MRRLVLHTSGYLVSAQLLKTALNTTNSSQRSCSNRTGNVFQLLFCTSLCRITESQVRTKNVDSVEEREGILLGKGRECSTKQAANKLQLNFLDRPEAIVVVVIVVTFFF